MALGELVVSIIGDMQGLSKTFSQVQTELGNVGSKISTVGQTMSSAGSAMTSGITVPLAAVSAGIGVTANAASEFDTGMRRVATMLPGITDTGFKDISNQALTLSKDFGSSTADMTDAMYQALSSGVPQDNIFTFMQDAEKLAIGGATDVVTATDVLTNAVNSYGAANLSTAQASDILFQGTKFGKSTVEELAASLSNVVPVAASLGIGFDDVNASLATMTIQGTPTAQATTQLRAIIDELSDSSSDASMAFKSLSGQTFKEFIKGGGDVGGAIQILQSGLGKTIPDMDKVTKAMNKMKDPSSKLAQQFNAIAGESIQQMIAKGEDVTPVLEQMGIECGTTAGSVSDFFARIEAGTGALQLATDNGNLYKQSMDGMGVATGATDQAFKTMSEGSGAALDRLKSSFEVLTIKIGDAFLPILADTLIPAFSSLIDAIDLALPVLTAIAGVFNSLPGPIKLAILGFVAFAAAIGPILIIAGSIASGIGAIAALFGAGGALAGAFAFAQTAVAGVVAALGTIALPITLIIAGVALLALAWKNNWGDIQGKFEAAKASIMTAATNLYNTLNLTWNGLIMAAGTLKTNLGTIWDIIVQGFNSSKTLIVNIINGLYNGLVSVYGWIVSSATGLYNGLISAYNSIVASLNIFKSNVLTAWETLKNNIKTVFDLIINIVKSEAALVLSALGSFYTGIKSVFNTIVAAWEILKNSVQTILYAWHNIIITVVNGIVNTFKTFYSNLKSAFNTIVSAWEVLKNSVQTILYAWHNIITTVANGIISTFKTFYSNLKSAFNIIVAALTTLKTSTQTILYAWHDLIKTVSSGIISTFKTFYSNLKSTFNTIVSACDTLKTQVVSKWNEIKTAIATKLNEIVNEIKNKASSIGSAIDSIIGKIKDKVSEFKAAGKAIMQGLIDGIEDKIHEIKDTINSVNKWIDNHMPHSPAKEGVFRRLPNWDAVFVDPVQSSLAKMRNLAGPISNTLSAMKSPLDSSISSGLNQIQNVSNVNSSSSVSSGDTVINVGPVSLSNNVDIETLVTKINQISADQRRQRGVFL